MFILLVIFLIDFDKAQDKSSWREEELLGSRFKEMSVHHTGEGMSKIMAECGCGQGSIHGSRPGSRPSDLCLLARPHLLKALQI